MNKDQTGQLHIKGWSGKASLKRCHVSKDLEEAEEPHAAIWERAVLGRKHSKSPKVEWDRCVPGTAKRPVWME